MNRPTRLAALLFLPLLAGCPDKKAASPAAPVGDATPVAPEAVAAKGWQTIDNASFSVEVPGAPKVEEGTEQTAAGAVKTTTWGVQGSSSFFAVSTADYPPGMMAAAVPSKVLEGARDGAMANVGGTVEDDIGVFLDSGLPKKKYPGREFNGSTKSGLKLAARLFLVDDRLYQLICVSPKASFNADDFKKFADSFKLKTGSAPASTKN
jgi:hypothetical protein